MKGYFHTMEKKQIDIFEVVLIWLEGLDGRIAFLKSELINFLKTLKHSKSFNDKQVTGMRKNTNINKKFVEVSEFLLNRALIKDSSHSYFTIGTKSYSDFEIVCSLYQIGYISYLSAMYLYGFTEQKTIRIDFSTPVRSQWKKYKVSYEREKKNYLLHYPSENIRIKNRYLNVYARSVAYIPIQFDTNIRVIGIGELFLEMIRYPALCGGFTNVMKIYEESASLYLNDIVQATNVYGSDIDKCRIGYILSVRLNIINSSILAWKAYSVSRGGSRKLLSSNPYSSIYNDEWCLSLNHPIFD